ncbi:MAG TPA: PRD domain-containing protein [Pseudogracilibacillus sp.]|nr:PRD domain-containing protein [Pseudogracilibacillus sp.]
MLDVNARQAQLVKLMIDKQLYRPAKYYAAQLNVSERTIFNDLNSLEEQLEPYDVIIDKKPNQGVKLTGKMISSSMFAQLINENIKTKNQSVTKDLDRQILIVKWLLIENRTLTFQSLSLELFCSTTVIAKDLEKLQYFMEENISLVSDISGTRIRGNELGIQRTLKRFVYFILEERMNNYTDQSYSPYLTKLFDKEIIRAVEQIMDELIPVLNENTTEQYLKSLYIFLLIITARSKQGFHINTLPNTDWKKEEYFSNYPVAVQIANSISSNLNFTFENLEIQHISNQLFAHRIELKLNNKYIENALDKDILEIISNVSSSMNINLTTDEKLYNSLAFHLFPLIYRLKTNIVIHNPLLMEVKNNYSVLFKMVWYAAEKFEDKFDIKLSDNEVSFITIYFQAAIERKVQMRKVLVVCQTGVVTSDLIINRIKNLLPVNIHFKLIAKTELQDENTSDVDFIISSITLPDMEIPIVYVSPLIKEKDLINIYSFYLKYSTPDQIQESNNNLKSIDSFIDKRYIFMNEKLTDKEECINKIIRIFEKNGVVSNTFKQTVYEREELGNTVIQGLIATPHGNKTHVYTSKISMMLTDHPVKWNRDSKVSLIILLAVTEEDMVYIRKLLGAFFRNIISMESIQEYLNNISTQEELINLFDV